MSSNETVRQAEELMQNWTKAQQTMWESWRAAMPDGTAQLSPEAWEQAISAWKEMMQRSLNAQADFVQFLSESMKTVPLAPAQMHDVATLMADTTRRWTDAQSQIFSSWIGAMGKASPAAMMQSMNEGTRTAFDAWRDTVNASIEIQRRIMESLVGTQKG